MENIKEKNTEDIKSCLGSVKIADDVVGMIAALAATEVEGVHGMAGNVTAEILDRVGVKALNKGAKVEVKGKNVKAFVSVVMEYGFNIPSTCQKIQDRVKNAIENMTGLNVADVDVRIAGIILPDTKE